MPVQLCGLDQGHHRSSALATAQGSREQPVGTPQCPGSDLVFHPVVVDGHSAIVQVARQRFPPFEAVIQRFGRAGPIRHFLTMRQHPLMQCIGKWFGSGLADFPALIRRQVFGFPFDLVEPADVFQCLGR